MQVKFIIAACFNAALFAYFFPPPKHKADKKKKEKKKKNWITSSHLIRTA